MGDDNWMKDFGFNALRLPRRDLRPKDVLLKQDGRFETKVGDVSMVVSSDAPLPEVSSGEPTATLGRQITKKLDVSFGLKLLGALIGAGASDKLGIDTGYKHARTLDVTYENVVQDSIPVIALQGWLENGQVSAPSAARVWLNDDELAAVTAVLRSNKLSVVAKNENGEKLDLSIPEVSGVVSGDIKVEAASGDSTKITFEGKDPIAFGYQAFQMVYEGDVSFGLKQVRKFEGADKAADTDRFADDAWTSDSEIEEIREEPVAAG
jgi:hypothetical protein